MTTNGTIEDCRARVAGAVRGLIDHQIDAIAEHHQRTGDSVWHSVHVVLDTPVCRCAACEQKH